MEMKNLPVGSIPQNYYTKNKNKKQKLRKRCFPTRKDTNAS